MASWQAHLTSWLVWARLKRRLATTRDVEVVRRLFTPPAFPIPRDFRITPAKIGGVDGEWVERAGADAPVLVYFHGGGYIACTPQTHRAITLTYARHGFRVFAPAYRLAPEHRFPAPLGDAVAVWRGLLESGVDHAVVSGESAGGGLSVALMLALRDGGVPLPAGAALFSPWTDLTCSGDSMTTNRRSCAMLTGSAMKLCAGDYLDGADPLHQWASPLFAKLDGMPPLLIHVGRDEVLRDDSVRLADRARAAGVAVELRVFPVVPHAWQLAPSLVPEARHSLAAAAEFLHAALRQPDHQGSAA